jgi:predicted protein tyrosine phosphatase
MSALPGELANREPRRLGAGASLSEAMEIFVYSRSALDAARPHEVPHVVISITSSPDDVARLRANQACCGVLRLSFPDADAPSERFSEGELFSRAHAVQIWAFVDQHRSHVERVLVHCDAGISRSSAVAAALARVLNGDDAEFFGGRYRPNMRVYRTLLDTRTG